MKDVVLKEENKRKVFTKKRGNNIIEEKYNLFKKDCGNFYEREGLYMDNIILSEIKKNLNWKEKFIVHKFKKTFIKIYKKGIEQGFNSGL